MGYLAGIFEFFQRLVQGQAQGSFSIPTEQVIDGAIDLSIGIAAADSIDLYWLWANLKGMKLRWESKRFRKLAVPQRGFKKHFNTQRWNRYRIIPWSHK